MKSSTAFGSKTAAKVSLVALLLAACAPGSGTTDDSQEAPKANHHALGGGNAHKMPMTPKNAKKIFSAPSGAKLTYRGGPVLSSVKVFTASPGYVAAK